MMNGNATIPMVTDNLDLMKCYVLVLLLLFRIRIGSHDLNSNDKGTRETKVY